MGTTQAEVAVRSVTDEEVDFFFENGWVKLPHLVDAESAAALLDGAKSLLGQDGTAPSEAADTGGGLSWFRTYTDVGKADENFRRLATSPELGRNVARLFGRSSSIRLMQDSLMVKLPAGGAQGAATDFHQDTAQHMFFEANSVNLWLALDEVTPEMGSMQFYSRSHKLGNLGNLLQPGMWDAWAPHIDRFCSRTEPVHYQPGDATIHANFTIHGTGENLGERPRWAWGAMLLPGDARYTGAQSYYTDGLGLEPFGGLDNPKFPVIYEPEG